LADERDLQLFELNKSLAFFVRDLLSIMNRGIVFSLVKLNFKYFAIGDSEIDYEFNKNTGFNPFYSNILRPADKNPQQISFISRDYISDPK